MNIKIEALAIIHKENVTFSYRFFNEVTGPTNLIPLDQSLKIKSECFIFADRFLKNDSGARILGFEADPKSIFLLFEELDGEPPLLGHVLVGIQNSDLNLLLLVEEA